MGLWSTSFVGARCGMRHAPPVSFPAWHCELPVLGLNLGRSSLRVRPIQRGAAWRATSPLYLVPPRTGLLAWGLFGQSPSGGVGHGPVPTALGMRPIVREAAHDRGA